MYTSLNDYLKKEYGTKVYKLALSAVSTCPNRDGTVGNRGCIFCDALGSGSFAEPMCDSVTSQIEHAKQRIKAKTKADKFIAYFQSFTNTYAPIDYLEKVFFEAIMYPQVVVLSIATRPDCLSPEVLNLLKKLNKIKPVWVELGLQTIHQNTADYIRRGYELSIYDKAVSDLNAIGIKVITHMIIGLPQETPEMITATADYIGKSGAWGIKLQLLHVLKGTDLEKEYNEGKFECLTLEKYTEILKECLAVLPPQMVIHRITGDGDKKSLVAPLWSADKKRVLNYINNKLNTK
ncbi:MAG: TIGR01212 family radical SAM protein [Clostridia bacterium]|nr:TIGR01212 family radical SAM protein [Clostridia bacterium]